MLGEPWVMGENYTICDPYLFALAQWMEGDGVNPARFPNVSDHRRRMSERPTVRNAIAQELVMNISDFVTPRPRAGHPQSEISCIKMWMAGPSLAMTPLHEKRGRPGQAR